jgi:hypothetical protein
VREACSSRCARWFAGGRVSRPRARRCLAGVRVLAIDPGARRIDRQRPDRTLAQPLETIERGSRARRRTSTAWPPWCASTASSAPIGLPPLRQRRRDDAARRLGAQIAERTGSRRLPGRALDDARAERTCALSGRRVAARALGSWPPRWSCAPG